MTIEIKFSERKDGSINIGFNGGSRVIGTLGEVKELFDIVKQSTYESIYQIGLLVTLLAVRAIWSSGIEPSRSNILRTLDEYYFVFQDKSQHEAFEQGLDDGINVARLDPAAFEAEVWRKLGR